MISFLLHSDGGSVFETTAWSVFFFPFANVLHRSGSVVP